MATTTAGFDVQFIEAIAYALNREVVLPDNYYNVMTPIQRQQAVSIAGLAQTEQIKHVMGLVNEQLVDGGTFADFQKAVKAGDIDINLPKHRLDNIFRTNIQGAYGRGRWYQQQQNKDERPYLMRDGINDIRQRPAHKVLDGVVRHIDDPFWQQHYAPSGYRCRCIMRSLTKSQAEAKGITVDDDLPSVPNDKGWIGGTPAQYTGNMNQLVNKTIAELAITYYKQSGTILAARQRIEAAITVMLAQPIPELAAMIDEAKELIEEQEA
ncbi:MULTISPECIES: phage minor head protein [unclassified Psychrobacter]|uniref:phage head morphogenesis protein n=1 Tax=unclassified Psychrobacter TaxID=196806 RepID=UPI0025E18F24|nr:MULTISPECIES: phage minor head protein [unclassified Psychrobacter]